MGTISVGTCGYHYNEWIGPFYPPGTRQEGFLAYYAGKFSVLELNFTYYQMPSAEQLQRMVEACGQKPGFAVKAHRTLTHDVDPAKWPDETKTYLKAIEPLRNAGRLEAVLFQFPHSFHYTADNRRHLGRLLENFSGTPSAVEFRNAEWGNNRVIEELKKRGVAYVSTDLPDLRGLPPVLDVPTSPLAYFRLHGRNAQTWWGSDSKARYDYLYSDEELEGAAERIKRIAVKAARVLVFFNNHARGQAVRNAETLKKILEKAGLMNGTGNSPS
ncbi:MAG: DUF72 domain-containing protein [Treponema sp.]|nr:DUF72 domain-containing protein [Treponema sp.]